MWFGLGEITTSNRSGSEVVLGVRVVSTGVALRWRMNRVWLMNRLLLGWNRLGRSKCGNATAYVAPITAEDATSWCLDQVVTMRANFNDDSWC